MKTSPAIEEETQVSLSQRVERDVNDLVERVKGYQNDMSDWLEVKREWWIRRMALQDRGNDQPWPGASEMWLPMSDVYIEQDKPFFMNLLFGGPRVVTMAPESAEAVDNVPAAQHMMQHILTGGGVHAMPDLPIQMAAMLESRATFGVGVLKTYYSYRTRAATETLRRDDMPGILGKLIFKPRMSDQDRAAFQARIAPEHLNPPEVEAMFGAPINPINAKVFKQIEGRLGEEVRALFEFDLDEKLDRAAHKKIMRYLREGTPKPSLAFMKREVLEDVPRMVQVPIQDLILPSQAMLDFSRAEVVCHRMRCTPTELRERAEDNVWDKKAVEAMLQSPGRRTDHWGAGGDSLTFEQDARKQIYTAGSDEEHYEYWQIYSYEDLEGEGFRELTVTEVDPDSGAMLRRAPFGADHGQMPFSAITFEVNDLSFRSSRGIPERLKDIEAHASAWHRHMENSMQVTSTPSFVVNRNSAASFDDLEWFPGLMIPVDDPQRDIAPVPMAPVQLQAERMQQFLMLWPERLVGGFDTQGLADVDAPERRTATEVNAVQATRGRASGMRGLIFAHQMCRPLQQVWSLWRQYGPKDAFVQITGEAPQTLTQAQIRGKFSVKPYAAVGDMDPGYRQAQATQRLQEAMQLAPLLQGNPEYQLNLAGAAKDKWDETDPIAAKRLLVRRTPEQAQAIREQLAEQAQVSQQLARLAQAAIENAPMDAEEMRMLMAEMAKRMPHGQLQQIQQEAAAAQEALNAAQAVAN